MFTKLDANSGFFQIKIQRFRLRLLQFLYDIEYIPDSQQVVADALSRAPLNGKINDSEEQFTLEVNNYTVGMINNLPVSNKKLMEIIVQQNRDPILKKVKDYCQGEWPKQV